MSVRRLGKIILWACFMLLSIIMISSCDNTSGDVENTLSDVTSNEGMKTYSVYFANEDWTDISVEALNIDQMDATESVIDKLVNTLIAHTEESGENIPVPEGVSYQRYIYDGQGHVTLMFNVDYETSDLYRIALCKMAFTKTLCQVESVETVEFQLANLINEEDIEIEEYNEASFLKIDDISVK